MRWQLDFVNRKNELKIVGKTIKDYGIKHALVFGGRGASGFSRFCYEMGGLSKSLNNWPVYVDGGNQSGFAIYSSVFETFYRENKKNFLKFLAKHSITEPGSGARHTGTVLAAIPGIGEALGEPFRQFSETLKTLRHNGYLQETFTDLLANYSHNNPIVFFIDDINALDKWSLDLIDAAAYSGANIKYVLGDITRDSNPTGNNRLLDKLQAKEYKVTIHKFLSPNERFIEELFFHYGKKIESDQIEHICYKCEGNIYKIISALNENLNGRKSSPISGVGELILKLLFVAGQPLRKTDFISIIAEIPDYCLVPESEVAQEIQKLSFANHIFENNLPDGDSYLKISSITLAAELYGKDSMAQKLFLTNRLFEFYDNAWCFSPRHSKSEIALLLFRLSKEADPVKAKGYAVDVIKLSFSLGTSARAKEYVEQVIDIQKPSNESEFFSGVTFNIASRNYEEALDLLNSHADKPWINNNYYRIAKCICEERCRNYIQFDAQLKQLLPGAVKDEEAVLRVYQINSLIHRNEIEKAKEIFLYSYQDLKGTNCYPYILRTSSSIYNPQQALSYIDEAITIFESKSNDFGYATTLANKALLLTSVQDYTSALTLLEKSRKVLQVHGIHHLNILENTLGLINLHLSNFDKAIIHFEKGRQLSNGEMSKLYFSLNLGVAYCFLGRFKEAIGRFKEYSDFVSSYPVDRVRQKYFSNLSAILFWSGAPKHEVAESVKLMKNFSDRKNPEQTFFIADKILAHLEERDSIKIKMTTDYFSLCHLEYWYSNPLTDLPLQSLPVETYR